MQFPTISIDTFLLQIYLHTFLIYYYEYNADAQILSLYEFDEREA